LKRDTNQTTHLTKPTPGVTPRGPNKRSQRQTLQNKGVIYGSLIGFQYSFRSSETVILHLLSTSSWMLSYLGGFRDSVGPRPNNKDLPTTPVKPAPPSPPSASSDETQKPSSPTQVRLEDLGMFGVIKLMM
jgi:hypothetical protein